MAANRTNLLYSVLGGVAAAALGTWILGSHIESPADAAARTAPPVPSPILVPVEQRVLNSEVVTRGTARFGLPQPISIAPSALKSSPGLVTTIPVRNTQFGEGSVMLTHSGRPVFVFQRKSSPPNNRKCEWTFPWIHSQRSQFHSTTYKSIYAASLE